jgi:hypothetical protein
LEPVIESEENTLITRKVKGRIYGIRILTDFLKRWCEDVHLIYLVQDEEECSVLLNVVISHMISQISGNFLSSPSATNFSRTGVSWYINVDNHQDNGTTVILRKQNIASYYLLSIQRIETCLK